MSRKSKGPQQLGKVEVVVAERQERMLAGTVFVVVSGGVAGVSGSVGSRVAPAASASGLGAAWAVSGSLRRWVAVMAPMEERLGWMDEMSLAVAEMRTQ